MFYRIWNAFSLILPLFPVVLYDFMLVLYQHILEDSKGSLVMMPESTFCTQIL